MNTDNFTYQNATNSKNSTFYPFFSQDLPESKKQNGQKIIEIWLIFIIIIVIIVFGMSVTMMARPG